MDIIVVASQHRKPVIDHYLNGQRWHLSINCDNPLTTPLKPEYQKLATNQLGAFRCFQGHQTAFNSIEAPEALILEDDAIPTTPAWFQRSLALLPLLNEYEVVSLHSRHLNLIDKEFSYEGWHFAVPKSSNLPGFPNVSVRKAYGSLAYMIKQETAMKIMADEYEGLPMDFYLATKFKFCALKSPGDSFWIHAANYGSVVENAK